MRLEAARRFVNRTAQLERFDRDRHDLVAGIPIQRCLINVCGVPGIGKSAFLAALWERYHADSHVIILACNLHAVAHIDLDQARTSLVQILDTSLDAALHLSAPPALPAPSPDDRDLASDFLTRLLQPGKPVFLLIDGWEKVADVLFSWFERTILLPLVRTERLLALLASQSDLRWRLADTRRRAEIIRLDPLNLADTSAQTESDAELSQLIFDITAGHPFANDVVGNLLAQHNNSVDWLKEHQAIVARQTVQAIEDRLAQGITEELRQVFSVLGLFREFDVNTLRSILPDFLDSFKQRSQSALQLTIRQMLDTKLVHWDVTLRSYQIEEAIRRILAQAILLNNRDRFHAIKQAALIYYERLIAMVGISRTIYVLEYLYHCCTDTTPAAPAEILELFQSLLTRYYTDTQSLTELRQRLLLDSELLAALDAHQITTNALCAALDQQAALCTA